MAIKRRDFQKLSSTVQEFLLKLPDEETSARLRDNLLHALHFLQLYYRILQNRDKNNDPLQWTIDHSLSPLTPFREAPDKFDWEWISAESQKVRQSLPKASFDNLKAMPQIIVAIRDGDLETVKQIVKQDPHAVNSTDIFTRDCVTYAVQFDNYEILKFLLSSGASTTNIASDSSTSLHRAVYKSNPEMVQLLLEYKANVNAQDCYNRAPLHWSVINQEVDCLKVLLNYSANVHIKDKDGMSPSMWACHLDHLEHFKLLSKIDNVNKKFSSSMFQDLETDNDGRNWLHWSVRKNEPFKCLNFLINSESALLRDKDGKTCLHIAAEQGALQACKLIIDIVGSKIVNERDNRKQTPLHLATLNGHARSIKILMDNGADATIKDSTGASPIDYVTKRNLFFCNSIIEICLRNSERRNRQGASSSNSVNSNGSESNLTPAPPTTPKNTFTRTFQHQQLALTKDLSGRPPRPVNNSTNSLTLSSNDVLNQQQNGELSKTAPASFNQSNNLPPEGFRNTMGIPPSPPTGVKTRPSYRGGWASTDRITSGSLRLSRASTRTSLASDDLDKYMNTNLETNSTYGGSLNNIENMNPTLPSGFINSNYETNGMPIGGVKPLAQPRIPSSNSANNLRILSGRNQETALSAVSYEQPPSQIPPPIKPRKSSSVASLNNSNIDSQSSFNQMSYNRFNNLNNNHNEPSNFNKISNSNTINHNGNRNVNNNNLNVEDISGDEVSITSVKGEGFASDLSDNEMRNQQMHLNQRSKTKKTQPEQSLKRPTTPMDFRIVDHSHQQQQIQQQKEPQQQLQRQESQQQSQRPNRQIQQPQVEPTGIRGIKFQQLGEPNSTSSRFNEWDPYAANRQQQAQNPFGDRQKSPLKSKQQQQSQNTSNFAHSFLSTDSSPRQSSGRAQLTSATVNGGQKLQTLSSQQNQQSNTNSANQIDVNSSSNLDLIISGQKLGGRKDASPTNITPREHNQLNSQSQQMLQQQQQLPSSQQQQRGYTRRLQPLDKSMPQEILNNSNDGSSGGGGGGGGSGGSSVGGGGGGGQFLRQKTSKTVLDRKKLEPIRGTSSILNMNSTSASHVDTLSNSLTENDNYGQNVSGISQNNFYMDDEPSISENTLSSDKQPTSQIINNMRVSKKKVTANF